MNIQTNPQEQTRIAQARESFSGRTLTNTQFDEAIAITGIIDREIDKSGAFKEKLGDYAYAMARTEKIDVMKAETVIRDLYKARTGQTMNQKREALMEREQKLSAGEKQRAGEFAYGIGQMIEQGDKISFYRAYSHQAQALSQDLEITEAGAKTLMKEAFQKQEGRDLYEWGKEVEEKFYRPQIEAEKQRRETARTSQPSRPRPRLG